MEEFDIVVGIHSIGAALKNDTRSNHKLFYTEEGKSELIKKSGIPAKEINTIDFDILSAHDLQEVGKRYFKEKGIDFQRIPSQVFLITSELETNDNNWLYSEIEKRDDVRILCLDQVSDVHNGAAILRTASFYGIDIVVLPAKRSFGFTPSFYRIGSGATEFVQIVQASNLSKVVSKLQERGVTCIGLTEHVSNPITEKILEESRLGVCLVLGKEETGISNAVLRQLKYHLGLQSMGDIKSLNVSVAAAIAMEKCFSKK